MSSGFRFEFFSREDLNHFVVNFGGVVYLCMVQGVWMFNIHISGQ